MKRIVRTRATVPVHVQIESKDGWYYATTPWAAREQHGLVTVRSRDQEVAVHEVLRAAGYIIPDVQPVVSTSATA